MSNILTITLNPTLDVWVEADVLRPTHKIRTSNPRFDAGGGGINVARVIAMLGGTVEAVLLAGGEVGAMIDHILAEEGIRRIRIAAAEQARLSFMVEERSTDLEYRFVAVGPAVLSQELQRCIDAVATHKAEYVVASGSLPDSAPTDTYAKMAEIAAARGAKFVLDSSGPGLRETLGKARIYLAKPSLGELEQLAGRALDEQGARETASALVSRGVAQLVAVTLGAEGAILASADGILRAPAIPIEARSSVGAGDSFLGAMVWALSEGKRTEEAFRYGLAAGAAAAMTSGRRLCQRVDVLELLTMAKPV